MQELDVFRYGWAKEVRVFPCSFCSKGCSSKHHLEQHMRTHTEQTASSEKGGVFGASQQQRVVCHLCPVDNKCSFSKKSLLTKHIAAEHPGSPTAVPAGLTNMLVIFNETHYLVALFISTDTFYQIKCKTPDTTGIFSAL